MKICAECKSEALDSAAFCSTCGTRFPHPPVQVVGEAISAEPSAATDVVLGSTPDADATENSAPSEGADVPAATDTPDAGGFGYGSPVEDDILVRPILIAGLESFVLLDVDDWDDLNQPTKDSARWDRVRGDRVIWSDAETIRPVAVVAESRTGDDTLLELVREAFAKVELAQEGTARFRRFRSVWHRRRWIVVAALLTVVGAGIAIPMVLLSGRAARAYLNDLRTAGLGGQFASDAEALAHGNAVCGALKGGGKAQGMPVDLIAVKHFCSQFAQGFHVLETITVKGTFTLIDTESLTCTYFCSPSISNVGGSCSGIGGYSDIGPGTDVVVTNGEGKQLTNTTLGGGSGGASFCSFKFDFQITEGEDSYNVSVSHRGTQHYTFSQLKTEGVALTLGS